MGQPKLASSYPLGLVAATAEEPSYTTQHTHHVLGLPNAAGDGLEGRSG